MKVDDEAVRMPSTRWRVRLHWLTVLALVLGFALILGREAFEAKGVRLWLLELHRWCGLLVLALCAARLWQRLGRVPLESPDAPPWMRAAATATHTALYLLLAALPMLGWALSSAAGQQVNLVGIPLPALVTEDEDLAGTLHLWHEAGAWALAALVVLHAAAAVWHHTVRRDAVLRTMWPPWPR